MTWPGWPKEKPSDGVVLISHKPYMLLFYGKVFIWGSVFHWCERFKSNGCVEISLSTQTENLCMYVFSRANSGELISVSFVGILSRSTTWFFFICHTCVVMDPRSLSLAKCAGEYGWFFVDQSTTLGVEDKSYYLDGICGYSYNCRLGNLYYM